jgi:hypothetical protein
MRAGVGQDVAIIGIKRDRPLTTRAELVEIAESEVDESQS